MLNLSCLFLRPSHHAASEWLCFSIPFHTDSRPHHRPRSQLKPKSLLETPKALSQNKSFLAQAFHQAVNNQITHMNFDRKVFPIKVHCAKGSLLELPHPRPPSSVKITNYTMCSGASIQNQQAPHQKKTAQEDPWFPGCISSMPKQPSKLQNRKLHTPHSKRKGRSFRAHPNYVLQEVTEAQTKGRILQISDEGHLSPQHTHQPVLSSFQLSILSRYLKGVCYPCAILSSWERPLPRCESYIQSVSLLLVGSSQKQVSLVQISRLTRALCNNPYVSILSSAPNSLLRTLQPHNDK